MKKNQALLLQTVCALMLCSCIDHGGHNCSCCGPRSVTHDQVIYGKADLHDAAFNSLAINGTAHLVSVSITEALSVNGKAEIDHSTINNATITGKAEIEKSSLTGTTVITGSAEIEDSAIGELILYTSGKQTIERSHIASLEVHTDQLTQEVVIELEDSTVDGNVAFKNTDHAMLVLKGTAQVKGQVIGAEVKHL